MPITVLESNSQVGERASKSRQAPAGLGALVLLFIVASFAALVVACADDSSPTPAPAAATAPPPTLAPAATPVPPPTLANPPPPQSGSRRPNPPPPRFGSRRPNPPPPQSRSPRPNPPPPRLRSRRRRLLPPLPRSRRRRPAATVAPQPTAAPVALNNDDLTRSYVKNAIEYYGENGLDATLRLYKSAAGVQDGRTLILINEAESRLLIFRNIPALEGQYVGPGSSFSGLSDLLEIATEEGQWFMTRGINPVTKQEEPRRVLVVLHDGLVFSASPLGPGGRRSRFRQGLRYQGH